MFNDRQIKDIVDNERTDVAEEMLDQWINQIDEVEKRDEFYQKASIETLYNLTINGDEEACPHYILKRIDENTLTPDDMKLLESAIKNLNFSSAYVGSYLFAMKNGKYTDTEKELFCYAVMEQSGDKKAHKKLSKAYKKNTPLIDEVDESILFTTLDHWSVATFNGEKYYSFNVEINPVTKDLGLPDYKSAYIVEITLSHENGRETDSETLYAAYVRGKSKAERLEQLIDSLSTFLSEVAEKTGLKIGDIYCDGKRCYHYGAGSAAKKAKTDDAVKIVSQANLEIDVSDDGRLDANVCKYCGGALDMGGVCCSCGKSSQPADDKIVIRKGKEVEALICTQCGSPVKLDKGGKTAFCCACGTTFAVNGSSLTSGIFGLNYENIRADMPQDAVLPKVEFVRASIADGAVTAIMPRNFIVMSDEMRRIKYRANAPKYIYTTPDSTVNLNLNFLGALNESDVVAFGQQMLSALKGAYPTAKFGEVKLIDTPRKIYFVDFITQASDQSVYNAMFFFCYNGQQGIGSWNCLGKDRWFWSQIFEHAVRTMEFK
ncbi:MAG: hypothetical protein K2M44_05355 [Clostridia bacterium]|nr:hypothetical protein [Clostridia bacterium]